MAGGSFADRIWSSATDRKRPWTATTIWIIVAGVVGTLAVIVAGMVDAISQSGEFYKRSLDFFLTAIIAGVVSLVFTGFGYERELRDKDREDDRIKREKQEEYERDQRERIRDIHREVRLDIIRAWNQAKAARRILRATAVVGPAPNKVVLAGPYDEQMRVVNQAQLSLENAARITDDPQVFRGTAAELHKNLENMEKYLNNIIKEYERSHEKFKGEPLQASIVEFEQLAQFVGDDRHDKSERFAKEFQAPFHCVLNQLKTLISTEVTSSGTR